MAMNREGPCAVAVNHDISRMNTDSKGALVQISAGLYIHIGLWFCL